MAYPTNSWSILPATDALFQKQKVTLKEMALAMGGGTFLMCERQNPDGKKTPFVLSSAGEMNIADGTRSKAHHDQNGRPYGEVTVLSSVFYSVVDGEVIFSAEVPDRKFPLFVFK